MVSAAVDGGARMGNDDSVMLPPALDSVGTGRRFVQRLLTQWHLDHLVDVAVLLASEALTNAVVHAATAVRLEVRRGRKLEVRVTDFSPDPVLSPVAALGLQSLLDEPDLEAEGGRGLMMIATLAESWGVAPAAAGKTVWFAWTLPA
jgi:anti-sigma regulatory factor (Ser/Thr protein kinase)